MRKISLNNFISGAEGRRLSTFLKINSCDFIQIYNDFTGRSKIYVRIRKISCKRSARKKKI